jgi:hypothetical protein
MPTARLVAVAGVLALGLALAACAPAVGPDAGPRPAPTSSSGGVAPTETPVVPPGPAAVIVLSGDSVQIEDAAGATIDAHPFTDDPADVVESLTSAIGTAPAVYEYDTADECSAAGTADYIWKIGDASLIITTAAPDAAPPWDTLDVRTSARSIGDVVIVTSAGFSVGDDVSTFLETLPPEQHGEVANFIWDRVQTYDSQPFGGTAFTDGASTVTFLGTPGLLQSWYC